MAFQLVIVELFYDFVESYINSTIAVTCLFLKFLSKLFISKTFTHKSHIKQDIKWALFRSECLFLGMFTN